MPDMQMAVLLPDAQPELSARPLPRPIGGCTPGRAASDGHCPGTLPPAYLHGAAHAVNAPFQTAELARYAVDAWRRVIYIATGQEGTLCAAGVTARR
jgi:hypothetical protein